MPVVKADAYGHGAVPVALALEAAGADGFCVAAFDEALELRAGGVRAPILVLYPVPAGVRRARPPGSSIALAVGDRGGPGGDAGGRGRPRRGPAARGSSSRSRRGSGAAGSLPAEVAAAAGARGRGARRRAGRACGRTSRRSRTRPATVAQVGRFEAALASIAAAGIDLPARHVAASAALLTDGQRGLRRRPARAGDLRPRPRRARTGRSSRRRPAALRPVDVAPRPPGPGRRPAGRDRDQLRADVPDERARAGSRRSRSATATAGRERCRTGPARSCGAGRVPLVGNVAMDAVMADVTDVPGRRSTGTTNSCCSGRPDDERITVGDLAQERTTISWEVVTGHVPAASSGVPCRGGAGRSADAHRAERIIWRASSSGTATSATWRSTPS